MRAESDPGFDWLTALSDAVARLALRRVGAVVIVADSPAVFGDDGVVIEGRLSAPLLVALLSSGAADELHGGAVVVRGGVVERAGVGVLRTAGWDWVGAAARERSACVVAVSAEDGSVRLGDRLGATLRVDLADLPARLADALEPQPGGTGSLEPILPVLTRSFARAGELAARGWAPGKAGIPSGFPRYDELTGGLHAGELTLFVGREGAGADQLVAQIALRVARAGDDAPSVLVLSPSRAPASVALELLMASEPRAASAPSPWAELSERAEELGGAPLWFDASPSLTASGLEAHVRHLRARRSAGVVVFLPELLVLGPGDPLWGAPAPRAHQLHVLRRLARALDLPIVAGARLSLLEDVTAELRALEPMVDRLASLTRQAPGDEVFVSVRSPFGAAGFRLRVSPSGAFDEPEDGAPAEERFAGSSPNGAEDH